MGIVFDFNTFQWVEGTDSRRHPNSPASMSFCVQNKQKTRKEVLPNIVQLGGSLPVKRFQSQEDTWFPVVPEATTNPESTPSPRSPRCPKFKNLFEYNKHYNDKFNLERGTWKIPSMGNNFLPFKKKNDQNCSEEVNGLYRPTFDRWYNRIVHENTIVLSPTETSTRVRDNIHDSTKLQEKQYIMGQLKGTGTRERFVRDEVHLPDVYPQCFTCRDCQRQYTSDIYNQTFQKRNELTSGCVSMSPNESNQRVSRKKQHCDVLGERYCRSCVERRNKIFSLQIENALSVSTKPSTVHYKSPGS